MNAYPTRPVRDICAAIEYGYTASSSSDSSAGPHFLRITDIVPDRLDWSSVPFCAIDEKKLAKHRLRTGDIVIARTGATTGWAKYINDPPKAVFASYLVRIRPDNTVDARYVGFVIESSVYKEFIQRHMGGAAQPNANAQVLTSFEIPLPPLQTQRRIAGILSAYDDLIENCQRRIQILEEMARSLYREWFVSFRYPGHESVPLVQSALGEIPHGWEVKKLGDISSYISRGISPRYDDEGTSLVLNQKCVREQRLSLEPARRQSKPIPKEKLVQFGDVVINSTGVGTLGRVAQIYETIENCTVDSHVTIARASGSTDLDFYGACLLRLQSTFERLGVGATGQTELGRSAISDVEVVVPTEELQQQFGKVSHGMRSATKVLGSQIHNLRQTRDLLLSRLMSGQLEVTVD